MLPTYPRRYFSFIISIIAAGRNKMWRKEKEEQRPELATYIP